MQQSFTKVEYNGRSVRIETSQDGDKRKSGGGYRSYGDKPRRTWTGSEDGGFRPRREFSKSGSGGFRSKRS
ncbi:MAG: hypothetical protein ACTHLD_03415 [Chitinophaga sp.]